MIINQKEDSKEDDAPTPETKPSYEQFDDVLWCRVKPRLTDKAVYLSPDEFQEIMNGNDETCMNLKDQFLYQINTSSIMLGGFSAMIDHWRFDTVITALEQVKYVNFFEVLK